MTAWSRMDGEPMLWWSRFEQFRLMGPDRSLAELANRWRDAKGRPRLRTPARAWVKACDTWHWRERAEAWDAYIIQIQSAEAEAEELAKWAKRRKEWREIENELGQQLAAKARQMLAVGVVQRTTVDLNGNPVTIEPTDWKLSDIPNMAKVASMLARLATGMATESRDVFKWSPDDCTDEQLARISSGEDPRSVLSGQGHGSGRPAPEGPKAEQE